MTELNTNVLDLIGQAVLLVRGSRITYANPAAAEILGIDCRGKELAKILGVEIAASQSPNFVANAVLNGKSFIVHATRKDGLRVIVLKEADKDYAMINDSFIVAMRSDITVMSMAAEVCRLKAEESADRELLSALATMSRSIAVASRMIGNVSTARSILTGELEFMPQYMDLSQLCKSCVDAFAEIIPEPDFRCEFPEVCIMNVDPKLLIQLLVNLLSNSIRHGKSKTIDVRLTDDIDMVVLTVSDDGCGIRCDELYNVFECYRGGHTLREMNRGGGFGLTVARGITEKHGGTILMESYEGKGTTVRILLRKTRGRCSMRSANAYEMELKELLLWAADCLPASCYSEKYMD